MNIGADDDANSYVALLVGSFFRSGCSAPRRFHFIIGSPTAWDQYELPWPFFWRYQRVMSDGRR